MIVTGASGLLGANLCLVAIDCGARPVAVSNRTAFAPPGAVPERVDLRDEAAVRALVERALPSVILHCAALTDVDACEDDRDLAFAVNADAAGVLARAAADVGARLVAVSTDAVFDGLRGDYTEDDPTAPANVYAASKLAGEQAVLDASPDHLVVRTTLYGWNAQPRTSLGEWALGRLERGDRVPGFTDAVFSPLEASTLGGLLLDLAATDASGVLHLGSRDAVSKYEFARLLADVFGHAPDRVDPTVMSDVNFRAARSPRTFLDSSRAAQRLGHALPTVREGLEHFRHLRDLGWPDRLRAATPPLP